ncbi:glycosyl hydrolase [Asticcacaulis sp. EMRT-3]|uniref:glycosyl hydrolase n=1 Tax=Asticcacaulis sp. EMRT-3 TaxID=3040349 RepID=UPI0024AE986C|nr:glycosyl hydrolase [Asticcacaulis sp. EMRT-3]MDI7776397.1 glycosyl hydrolase [Asticcacaulis sp. EMRT-3]
MKLPASLAASLNTWLCAAACAVVATGAQASTLASPLASPLAEGFIHPPAEARPLVRWWWFGPAVEPGELKREITAMRAGGFGGFEIQPVYPLALDDPAKNIRNLPYLSSDFLKDVRFANSEGRAEGLRVSITLGSGWPYGGPHITPEQASAQIKLLKLAAPIGGGAVTLSELRPGEHRIAAFVGHDPQSAQPVDLAALPKLADGDTFYLFVQTPTGQQVKRAAVGAEGLVLDHMDKAAVAHHLDVVADPLIRAFGDQPPWSVFSDSLEVYGADWTDDMLAQFQKRRGYDLKPHLFDLFYDTPSSAAVRHDWGQTMTELVDERYLTPITDWAHVHNTLFRAQVYGVPPVSLSSNRFVDLPEGEGPHWRQFSTARWASSANHIYGRPVTSAESWTWLHTTPFRATPLDIKAEADTLMLEGINQFVAHGWPYTPPKVADPGWSFYAAAVFNDHNPWWGVMPDVTAYLTRMSWLLRQGDNVADVALFLPEDDALAAITPGKATINGQMDRWITPQLTASLLDAGYNFDYVDAASIAAKGVSHKILILPDVARLDPETDARLRDFVAHGGHIIALGRLPDSGTGLMNAATDAATTRATAATLFPAGPTALSGLPAALRALNPPDVAGLPPGVGFVHRHMASGDIYFIANTTNAPITARPVFRDQPDKGQWWNPVSGQAHLWTGGDVALAPYESRVFVFGAAADAPVVAEAGASTDLPLTTGWRIAFGGEKATPLNHFGSWADDPTRAHFSGTVTYSRRLDLSSRQASGHIVLDFGPGQPTAPPAHAMGTSARLDPPVREAAEIFVNGKRAGSVWAAPFVIDLTGLVHAGQNQLEVRVSNTAINELSGRPPADYSALNARYGQRFSVQGMNRLKPLPSGMMTAPLLEVSP